MSLPKVPPVSRSKVKNVGSEDNVGEKELELFRFCNSNVHALNADGSQWCLCTDKTEGPNSCS